MDYEKLKQEYKTLYRSKLHADLTFITLIGGILGGLIGKLIGSLIGLIIGFIFGIIHFKNKINEMEEKFQNGRST